MTRHNSTAQSGPQCKIPKSLELPSYERNRIIHKAQNVLRRSNALLEAVALIDALSPEHMHVVEAWEESQAKRYQRDPWCSKKGAELEIDFDGLRFVVHEDDWYSPTGDY